MARADKIEKQMDKMTTTKTKGVITIAGYEIKTKTLIIVGAIIGLIVAISTANQHMQEKKKQEEAKAMAQEQQEALQAALDAANTQYTFDYEAAMQESLTEQYGVAPEGFKWDYLGNLVSIGTDTSSTVEDITYMFLRSLSILDFTTAEHYSIDSTVKETYTSYYNSDYGLTDYYSDFERKEYKYALTTMSVDRIGDIAVFADGTEYITVYVDMLDLTDKDFWLADKDTIYAEMEKYERVDDDETKKLQYLYDYVYNAYTSGLVGKRSVEVELILGKNANGGWLVTNDRELDSALRYANGVDVVNHILNEYQDYMLEKDIQTVQDSINISNIDDENSTEENTTETPSEEIEEVQ